MISVNRVAELIALQIDFPSGAVEASGARHDVINSDGALGAGANIPDYSVGQDREITNDTNWSRGAHNLKFGIDVQWIQTYNWNARNIAAYTSWRRGGAL